MKELLIFGGGYLLCLIQVLIAHGFGKSAQVQDEPFADDPRPALLREQAE